MKKYGDQRFWGSAETRAQSAQKNTPKSLYEPQSRSVIPQSQSTVNPEQPVSYSRYLSPEKSFAESRATGNETFVTYMPTGVDPSHMRNSSGTSAMGSSQIVVNS
jgi:hypothetical protein